MKPNGAFPGGPGPFRNLSGPEVFVHAVDRRCRLGPALEQARVFDLGVVVVVELAVDEVAEVGRIVGQVELLEELDEVVEVENDWIILKPF